LNDCKRAFRTANAKWGGASWKPGVPPGDPGALFTLVTNDTAVVMKYYSLPASDYSKMNVKCITPYNEFTSYKTVSTSALVA